ncbi:thiamine phosphate synthase [Leucothrix arctica]|uniref:Thiamine-phosphate synthase n=1 Tax=Leucothrix arctica TaxID=1481894 RepID=A0A317CF11_9GAMM|nr:thiamine phosphate synthase [Leucothrix arctica]PWQ96939.1 thiamine phosphate synthase [Leucothrix arctica]
MNNVISVSKIQTTESILLIGGTDPSGAGLQSDLRVVHALGLHAYSVTSAVTAQHNTGVSDLGVLNAAHVKAQLVSVQKALSNVDARPLAAIKIGMLGDEYVINAVREGIELLRKEGHAPRIIIDPVIVASSGERLLTADSEIALMSKLFPLADVITPNLDELAQLTQMSVDTTRDIERATHCLLASGARSILLKGGHFDVESEQSSDYFSSEKLNFWLIGKRWPDRENVRGTGCLFATAITCASAQGYAIADAIVLAKTAVSRGIRQAESIGGAYQARLGDMSPHDWSVDYQDFPLMTPEAPDAKRPVLARCDTLRLGIYPVVDSVEWVEKLINEGIQTIQLRLKTDTDTPPTFEELDTQIEAAVEVCRGRDIRLFINDHWELAIKHGAYGIHLGQEDLYDADIHAIAEAGCRLGVSTHSYTEVARASWINPSYIALGPIYATTSKDMPWVPQGVAAVKRWVDLLKGEYPLVAIGGINLERAKALKSSGIGSVAMITAITKAEDYRAATKKLIEVWEKE